MRNRNQYFHPKVGFEKVWRIAERVAITTALVVVFGTLGFVSVHAIA